MLRVSLWLILLFAAGSSAEIYRWVDAEGQTHFADRPLPGSELVGTRGAAAPTDSNPAVVQSATTPLLGPYSGFEIVAPENNQTFRVESGSLPVSLLLDPPLMAGHRLELLLDGVPISTEEPIGTQLILKGVSFGTHTAVAHILDATGLVARSAPVSFHLRKPLPPGVLP